MKLKIFLGTLGTMLALGAGNVALGGPSYPTKLSINYSRSSGGYFSGNLQSHAGCVGGRKVSVYQKASGSDPAVGNGTVAANGSWRVSPGKTSAGDYYAKTKGLTLNSGGKCAAGKSVSTHVS